MAVAMLRGVNVGGHQKIQMAALRTLCVSLGLRDVQTFIQSGNLVFREDGEDPVALARRLENAIEAGVGFRRAGLGLCGFGGILRIRFKISSRSLAASRFVKLNPRSPCEQAGLWDSLSPKSCKMWGTGAVRRGLLIFEASRYPGELASDSPIRV